MPSEKTRGGLLAPQQGLIGSARTRSAPALPALCRKIVDCNIFMSTHKQIVARAT
nr:MAG TPA: hypothetical protein [Caudoviricetes sp.]